MVTKKTRLVSGLAAFAMLISMLAAFVIPATAESNWTETAGALTSVGELPDIKDYSSSVTEYKVTDFEGMEKLATLVIGGNNLENVAIYQANDIDMEWTPFVGIGGNIFKTNSSAADYAFSGTFDGNGYVIENLYVLRNNDLVNSVGLFGCTDGATLKNIGIASGLIVGGHKVGAIVGKSIGSTILNCWNAATVVGGYTDGTAGIVGYAEGAEGKSTVIANCYNLGLVFNREKNASGIVGYVASDPEATIANCYNAGEIVTGLIGYGDAPSSSYLEAYAVIMGADFTVETASNAANNYYIKNGCKVRSVKEQIEEKNGFLGDGVTPILTTDDATGLDSTGGLADMLNSGNVSLGNGADYTVKFEDSDYGYPVLTYTRGGSVIVKRVAHTAENVMANTWSEASPLFAKISTAAKNGGWAADPSTSDKLNNLTISSANDLFVLGLITSFGSNYTTSYGNSVTLAADIDMNDMSFCESEESELEYFVPISSGTGGGTGYGFNGTFDGNYHVIRNWKVFAAQVGGNVNGGLISVVNGNAVIKNLGMINAYGDYDHFVTGGYSYPALMVEREYGALTMENCFVTGTLDVESSAMNANNNGGVFSTTWAGNDVTITNCWADVDVINPATASTAAPTKARVIGKIPAANTTCPSENNYFIADVKPAINEGSDNGAAKFQTMLSTEFSKTDGTLAAYLNDVIPIANGWACKNNETTFAANAQEATYLLKVELKMGDYVYDTKLYSNSASQKVELPSFPGFELDAANSDYAEAFTMPKKTVILQYSATVPDYTIVRDLYAQYEQIDLKYIVDGDRLNNEVLLFIADLLEAVDKGTVSNAEGIQAISKVMTTYASLDVSMRTDYPNFPEMKDYELYASMNTAKSWLITDREDWVSLVENAEGNNFSGHSFHFVDDLDMQNVAVAPVAPDNDPAFRGKIYGHGHVIKNLLVEWNVANGCYVGLIGSAASGCVIQDLGIESGLIRAHGTASGEAMVGSFIGQGADVILQHCWNAANVESTEAVNTNGQTTSGIARTVGNSVIDGCFNVGSVRGYSSNSYAGTLSGYTQSSTVVWNSFALGNAIGKYCGFVRYTGTVDTLKQVQNSYTAGNTNRFDYGNDEYNTSNNAGDGKYNISKYVLGYDAYQTGEMAWLLNTNSEYHKIKDTDGDKDITLERTYYTVENGKTVFGTEANQTRKVTYLLNGVEIGADYVSANTEYTLNYVTGATYELVSGTATLDGNVLTMGQDDVTVKVVVNTTLDYTDLLKAMSRYDEEMLSYMKDSAAIQAQLDAAKAAIAAGTYADQDAVAAAAQALNAAYQYAGYPYLPSITKSAKYSDAPGYLVGSLAELEYLASIKTYLTVDQVVYLTADIEVPSRASAANDMNGLKASIDGKGHTIKGITVSGSTTYTNTDNPRGWLGTYTGNYIKNLVMDSWTGISMNWQGALLVGYAQNTNMVIENIKAVNCSVQSSTTTNGVSLLVGYMKNDSHKITFKNIHIENCTLDRNTRAGNSAFLIGRAQRGTLIAEDIYLINNTVLNNTQSGGAGIAFGEVTCNTQIKNLAVFNTTTEAITTDNAVLIGTFKQADSDGPSNPSLKIENVIALNNGAISNLIYRGNTSCSITASNIYADIDDSVIDVNIITDDVIELAAIAYDLNKTDCTKWEMVGSLPAFDTDGKFAVAKVTFVDGKNKTVAELYTDYEGHLIGLTSALYAKEDWGYESYSALKEAVFTGDTTIEAVPCDHIWDIRPNGDGKNHKKVCVRDDGCGRSQIEECSFVYTDNGDGTHTKTCSVCGYEETEACKTVTDWTGPSCEQDNELRTTCTDCGAYTVVKTAENTALDHAWECNTPSTNGTTHIATCTRDGCNATEEQNCVFEETQVAHTTTTKGYTHYECACGYSYDVEDETFAHDWDQENGTVVKYPTATEVGSMKCTCTCADCEAYGYVELPKLTDLSVLVSADEEVEQGKSFEATLALVNNDANEVAGLTAKVTYDADAMTLDQIEFAEVCEYTDDYAPEAGVVYLSFANVGNVSGNATFATLTFTVKADVEDGSSYTIAASVEKAPNAEAYESDTGAADENNKFVTVGGSATIVHVSPYLWGDANSDGVANLADAILIMEYLGGKVTEDQLDMRAANTTKVKFGDAAVDTSDVPLILQYVVGLFDPENPNHVN